MTLVDNTTITIIIRQHKKKLQKVSFLTCLFFFFLTSCGKKTFPLVTIKGHTMGTTYQVKLAHNISPSKSEQIKTEIDQLLKDFNQSLSTYIPSSEIVQFNNNKSTKWVPVSKDFYTVVKKSQEIYKKTVGAFDITITPLVNLWGFGPDKSQQRTKKPSKKQIKNYLRFIGLDKLEIKENPYSLRKKISELTLDLSGVAKGYGVDRVSDYLKKQNFHNFLVEIGGEIKTQGYKIQADLTPWIVAIETPQIDRLTRKPHTLLNLVEVGMATSGNYRQFFKHNNQTYSHTIDPRTGTPITHHLASVTVILPTSMEADAWATAISVLGPEMGLKVANKYKIPLFMIVGTQEKQEFKTLMTDSFRKYIKL